MSHLHIALVRQKYNAAGGAERFVSRAIQALANDGAQITLLTRKWENLQGMQAIRLNPFYLGNVWRDAYSSRNHSIWCNPTSVLPAATSIAPAMACIANGWHSGDAYCRHRASCRCY